MVYIQKFTKHLENILIITKSDYKLADGYTISKLIKSTASYSILYTNLY